MREYVLTRKDFTKRVTEREDNHYYKYDMVREIINMYNEELAKALMNGETINIYGIGSITPLIRYNKSNALIPAYSEDESNWIPFVEITFHKSNKLRETLKGILRKNLKEKGKLELSEGRPPISDEMKEWEAEYVKKHK